MRSLWSTKGHRDDDEFFLILDGEIRIQLGDEVIEGVAGSLLYGFMQIADRYGQQFVGSPLQPKD